MKKTIPMVITHQSPGSVYRDNEELMMQVESADKTVILKCPTSEDNAHLCIDVNKEHLFSNMLLVVKDEEDGALISHGHYKKESIAYQTAELQIGAFNIHQRNDFYELWHQMLEIYLLTHHASISIAGYLVEVHYTPHFSTDALSKVCHRINVVQEQVVGFSVDEQNFLKHFLLQLVQQANINKTPSVTIKIDHKEHPLITDKRSLLKIVIQNVSSEYEPIKRIYLDDIPDGVISFWMIVFETDIDEKYNQFFVVSDKFIPADLYSNLIIEH